MADDDTMTFVVMIQLPSNVVILEYPPIT
jgi:hypothetical protein